MTAFDSTSRRSSVHSLFSSPQTRPTRPSRSRRFYARPRSSSSCSRSRSFRSCQSSSSPRRSSPSRRVTTRRWRQTRPQAGSPPPGRGRGGAGSGALRASDRPSGCSVGSPTKLAGSFVASGARRRGSAGLRPRPRASSGARAASVPTENARWTILLALSASSMAAPRRAANRVPCQPSARQRRFRRASRETARVAIKPRRARTGAYMRPGSARRPAHPPLSKAPPAVAEPRLRHRRPSLRAAHTADRTLPSLSSRPDYPPAFVGGMYAPVVYCAARLHT